ncbi:M56 family metallopeptidase [Fluviicola taffensis]|uniref:Peptidase M56 BlaR1 n=1 Tax=Fluviicola taffensis (strain DSM 16823 / NCIMB 13979 / RW262) TaxID=755732 RepID=F2ICH2_FLUTR|nr:M56 family metallopeptidase [Fluviicola taffensis]AEA45442.1 peptidase M56 BlaR1 [Fluviicola taffensis DSM 16823]
MNFLVNDSIIKAVSWTIIHSLWLGLAAALLAGLTLLLTKKATSAIRYNLLAGLSIVFLVTIGFIFYNEFETQTFVLQADKLVKSNFKTEHLVSFSGAVTTEEASTPLSLISTFISKFGSWIVFSWFVVFMFKCIRMTGDLRQVYRARNYQTIAPPEMWRKRVSELQVSLRIKRNVQLLESKLVTIPSVTGFFKPVVLVPVGLLNNIPQDQVEAILLHELAHIRRSDYAVNLMQTFIEILFFFNPGILWISSLLKDERENCCDDLAISVTNNKKEFVNALISFQEYNMNTQRFALQFGDQKMKLADRAKRILFNSNKMLSVREKYFLSACVAMSVVLFLVVLNVNSSSAQEIKLPASDALSNEKYNPKDIPEGTAIRYVDEAKNKKSYVYIFKKDGVLYQIPENLENLKVDGELITRKNREKYLPQIKQLINGYEAAIASSEIDGYTAGDYPEVDLTEEQRIIDEASKIINSHSAIIDKHSAVIDKHVAVIDKQVKILEAETQKKDGKINWKKHDDAQRRIEEEQAKIQVESDKIDIEARKIDEQSRKIDEQSRKIDAKLKQQEKEMRLAPDKDITQIVIDDLKKAGYKGEIHSFELNEKILIINGKTQSESLFREVKKHIKPGMRILHNIDVH